MKKYILIIIGIITVLLLSSCKKEINEAEEIVDEFTQFTIEFDEMTPINFPIAIPPGTYPAPIDPVATDNDAYANNNTAKNLIESAVLQNARMEIISPEGADFSFLQEVYIYLDDDLVDDSDDTTDDGLPKILVASNLIISETTTIVPLNPEDVNLVEYLKKETINYSVILKTDETISAGDEYNILFHSEFLIDAKILGI